MVSRENEAFLYTQSGVNEQLTTAAREELKRQGVSFEEIDLTGFRLDEEWPGLPVISSRVAFVGSFRNPQVIRDHVTLIKPPEPQT